MDKFILKSNFNIQKHFTNDGWFCFCVFLFGRLGNIIIGHNQNYIKTEHNIYHQQQEQQI